MGQALYVNGTISGGDIGYAWGVGSPDETMWSPAGVLDIRIRLQLANWQATLPAPIYLPSQWADGPEVSGGQAYEWTVRTDGTLRFKWVETDNTTVRTISSTAAVPFTNNDRVTLRVEFTPSTGTVLFWYRSLDTDGWTSIAAGSPIGSSSVRSQFEPLRIGVGGAGGDHGIMNEVHYIEWRDGGVLKSEPRFNDPTEWTIGPLPPPQAGRGTSGTDNQGISWFLADANLTGSHLTYIVEATSDPGGTTPVNRDLPIDYLTEAYTSEYRIDGAAWEATTYNTGTGYWEAAEDTTLLTDTSHTIEARVTRQSDSAVSSIVTHTFYVDNTAGTTPVSRDLPISFEVQTTVSRDLSSLFETLDAVSRDLQALFDVQELGVVGRDVPALYDVSAVINRDIQVLFDVAVLSQYTVFLFAR